MRGHRLYFFIFLSLKIDFVQANEEITLFAKISFNLSNNTGTTHYDSLQGSFWSDQKNSHNEVIMTS